MREPIINLYHGDCMEAMRAMKDKAYDLAIVDPPYGGGQHFNFRYGTGDKVYDSIKPEGDYWKHLFRISKNQIIWGANYFTDNLPINRCWISWYKGQPIDSFSDFELAWTSFDETSRSVKLESYGFNHADKRHSGQSTIHPTKKPVSLYKWLLKNYAASGDKILDTHGGSGSILIACHDMGFEIDWFEIDEEYFKGAKKRFENHKKQLKLFQ